MRTDDDVVGCTLLLLLLPLSILWTAWVLMVVWNWWMPPAFGWPALTFAQAVAVGMVKMAVKWPSKGPDEEDALDMAVTAGAWGLMSGCTILAVAGIGHLLAF